MPNIEPLAGVHYDPARTGGLTDVIGPPEDVPSREHVLEIIAGKPYHCLRLEFGDPRVDFPEALRSRYFDHWLTKGILIRPNSPAFYVHEHRYRDGGLYRRRLGLLAAADLRHDRETGFRPHEDTIPANLQFRVDLLRLRQLTMSSIYTLIRDGGTLRNYLEPVITGARPYLAGYDKDDGIHRLWRIEDRDTEQALQEFVRQRPLYIADGHHRYAAAQRYRAELVEQGIDPGPANFAMTLIVSEDDPGLNVLPIHREVRSMTRTWDDVLSRIGEWFSLERLQPDELITPASIARRVARFTETSDALPEFLALLHVEGQPQLFRLTLKDWALVDSLTEHDGEQTDSGTIHPVRRLDITVLHRAIMDHALAIPADRFEELIEYEPDPEALADRVISGESAMGLFARRTRIDQILAVADSGAHMPQKSTWFTPKVPAGLMLYDLAQRDF